MRPLYPSKPARIKAHIALSYGAFALMRHLEYRIKIIQKVMSLPDILRALNSV